MPGPVEQPGLPDPFADGINAFLPVEQGGSTTDSATTTWYPANRPWPASQPRSIRLTGEPAAAPGAAPASLSWTADGVLHVRLATGREVVLQLSSTPAALYTGQFAVGIWAQIANVDLAHTDIGLNPALSPVRPVHLVHAVRKPLVSPQWTLPDTKVVRPAGATYAEVSPTFATKPSPTVATIGLDPGSTGASRSPRPGGNRWVPASAGRSYTAKPCRPKAGRTHSR
jgi:hypothetical protein